LYYEKHRYKVQGVRLKPEFQNRHSTAGGTKNRTKAKVLRLCNGKAASRFVTIISLSAMDEGETSLLLSNLVSWIINLPDKIWTIFLQSFIDYFCKYLSINK
jgi:hypothetical protein